MLCELALHITASLISTEQDSASLGIGRCESNSFKFSLSFRFQAEAPNPQLLTSTPLPPPYYLSPYQTISTRHSLKLPPIIQITKPFYKHRSNTWVYFL